MSLARRLSTGSASKSLHLHVGLPFYAEVKILTIIFALFFLTYSVQVEQFTKILKIAYIITESDFPENFERTE